MFVCECQINLIPFNTFSLFKFLKFFLILHRSTAVLENFQNLILKYSSKRHSYTPPVYKGRNIIAALDHNYNRDRDTVKNKNGSLRYLRHSITFSCNHSDIINKC